MVQTRRESRVWGIQSSETYRHRHLLVTTRSVKQREIIMEHIESARQAGALSMDMESGEFLIAVARWFKAFRYSLPESCSVSYRLCLLQ